MLPSVRQVLALPALTAGRPLVLTGEELLDRPVRWVHVGEIPELASMLRGGELVLTTGVALGESPSELAAYVDTLAAAGACALVIELGRRFGEVPASVVRAGRERGVPVVALRRPVRFVAVTETVHALIVNEQYELLRRADLAHREFTELSIEGASVPLILQRLAEMTGLPVVLEDLAHRVVAYSCAPGEAAELLDGWEARSRQAGDPVGTGLTGPEGWLVTPVGPRRQRWGRLVLPTVPVGGGERPLPMLIERAAEALAINRLVESDRAGLVQQAHRGLLQDLQRRPSPDERELTARAEALGLAVTRHSFVGLAVASEPGGPLEPVAAEARDRALSEAVLYAARQVGVSALASPARGGLVLALAAVPAGRSRPRTLTRLATALADRLAALEWPEPHVVGAGPDAPGLGEAAASLAEAGRVAEVAAALPGPRAKPYVETADVRLRGLIALLREDPRVISFAESELGRLLRHDATHGSDLVATLAGYLATGGNKVAAARAMHLSRPALYARLTAIERLLEVSLSEPDSMAALHVAMLVRETSHEVAGRP